jgi:predicted ATPase
VLAVRAITVGVGRPRQRRSLVFGRNGITTCLRIESCSGESRTWPARRALLCTEGRLLTLTGTGGCGKTRLALELASALVDEFADGGMAGRACATGGCDVVPQAIISTRGLRKQSGDSPISRLVSEIGGRRLLLALDKCQHLIDTCAEVLKELLDGCPNLRVLITSREPCGLPASSRGRYPDSSFPIRTPSQASLSS